MRLFVNYNTYVLLCHTNRYMKKSNDREFIFKQAVEILPEVDQLKVSIGLFWN